MINKIDKERYQYLVDALGSKVTTELNAKKNSLGFIAIEMVSEDGLNQVQGVALMDVYETQRACIGQVKNVLLHESSPEGWNGVLVENLIRVALDGYDLDQVMAMSVDEHVKHYLDQGFEITVPGKPLARGGFGASRVVKVLEKLNEQSA